MTPKALGSRWTIAQIEAFARQELSAMLTEDDEIRIAEGHRNLLAAATHKEVYGLSTGVGARRFVAVERDLESCVRLWQAHALQIGETVDPQRTRATLLIRSIQIAQGGSGVSSELAAGLAAAAAGPALPTIHYGVSLGTGDIGSLAAVALHLTQTGVAFLPSDGLPFMSSGALTYADAALTLQSSLRAFAAGIELSGLVARAVHSTHDHFSAEALAPQHAEVQQVADRLRAIRGSGPAARVQEPFSVRLAPHSHGSVMRAWQGAADTVEIGINAKFENPVALSHGDVAHVGNFYTIELALAIDGLLRALAHEASLAAARLGLLLDARFTGAADFLSDGSADATGAMMLEYAAASAVAEIREAAAAHGAYGVNVSQGAEEHAPFTAHAVRRLSRAEGAYRTLLACIGVALGRLPGGVAGASALVDSAHELRDRDLSAEVVATLGVLDQLRVSVS
ncbi:Histidine ammonia-lyase [Leucobacter aridicollis]|uniref:aromatic amino acid lyase n=1 Tax=Leucobacter aridicollis TaxID=283878 RepID=UPI0037C5D0D8